MAEIRTSHEGLKKELRDVADELQKLADDVRLRLHLASMEARTSWAEFEPRLIEFRRRIERTAGETGDDVRTLASELKDRLKEFHRRVAH